MSQSGFFPESQRGLRKRAFTTDIKDPFSDLHLIIANGFVSSKLYDKRDDFDFDIINFPCLDGDVPRHASYGVYISPLIRFARVCNHVADFVYQPNFSSRAIGIINFEKYSKFYRRHDDYEFISRFNFGLETLLREGNSEPEVYGDLFTNL